MGELVSRPYSYVSSPNDDFLEIIYVNVPDGVLTPKLHELKVGDKLQVMEKSVGFFTMSEVPRWKKSMDVCNRDRIRSILFLYLKPRNHGKGLIMLSLFMVSDTLTN